MIVLCRQIIFFPVIVLCRKVNLLLLCPLQENQLIYDLLSEISVELYFVFFIALIWIFFTWEIWVTVLGKANCDRITLPSLLTDS